MDEDELEHTADSGEKAVDRLDETLDRITATLDHLINNTDDIAKRLSKLELVQAAEKVPESARQGVNDAIETASSAGNVAAKSVDVPLAVTEDVIHDTGKSASEVEKATKQEVARTRKLFKSKRRRNG